MEWNLNKNFNSSRDFYSEKSHFAAAIISNCKDSSKRIEYINNSVCKDYITEKFFAILQHNIIPVVLGGGTYEKSKNKIFILKFQSIVGSKIRVYKCQRFRFT